MKSRGRRRHQQLPASGPVREALRDKGQFWTPGWVAEAMVDYVIGSGASNIFDPAVGEGAFFRAAKAVASEEGRIIALRGTEIDPGTLDRARQNGLTVNDLASVEIADFLSYKGEGLPAIVANPPYIRHHRIPRETKDKLRRYGRELIGTALDGRAGYHVYFLLHALTRLAPDGRLAFIMPADTVEGIFSVPLWGWITRHYRLDAVVTFAPRATPFPGVDTNAVVCMIRNARPAPAFVWARCEAPENVDLRHWVRSGFTNPGPTIEAQQRGIAEGLATGLSRPPRQAHNGPILADFARTIRGIAPGDTSFFFLTRARAKGIGIPDEFLIRAIGRTRDLIGDTNEVTTETLNQLDAAGRPTYLFSPDARPLGAFPSAVRAYLLEGEAAGLPRRPLISQRRPWYKMEKRSPPAFLFAYLGRRNVRFIRNRAGVVPLNGFLCIYARNEEPLAIEQLAQVLGDPRTIANLARVGKSYGDGAIKVEPRAMDRLPLPADLIQSTGLRAIKSAVQLTLLAD